MKKFAAFICCALLAVSVASADVLFTDEDRMSLDILVDNSSFRSGFLVGVGYGLNQRLEFDLNYANVEEGGEKVTLIMPGFKCYLLRPGLESPWFLTVDGDYVYIATASGSGSNVNGYFLASNLGYDLKIWKGYKIIPYAGLLFTRYEIGTASLNNLYARVGGYFGVPLGGGSVVYFKQAVTFMESDAVYAVAIGYHFLLN